MRGLKASINPGRFNSFPADPGIIASESLTYRRKAIFLPDRIEGPVRFFHFLAFPVIAEEVGLDGVFFCETKKLDTDQAQPCPSVPKLIKQGSVWCERLIRTL